MCTLEEVAPRADRHDDLFQRCVARPFPDAVDGSLHLARAVENAVESIRHRHAEIVVAMYADRRPRDIPHSFPYAADERPVLLRHRVSRRIRNIDDGSSGIDHRLQHLEQVFGFRAARVLRIELHVIGILARAFTASTAICRIVTFFSPIVLP